MKKVLSISLSLLLFFGCVSFASAVVGAPEAEEGEMVITQVPELSGDNTDSNEIVVAPEPEDENLDEIVIAPISHVDQATPIKKTSSKFKSKMPSLTASPYSTTKIKLTWKKVTSATGYLVYRATSKSGTYKKVATVTGGKLTYTNTGLTSNKTYYYKIRACQKKSGKTYYSKYSAVKYAKTKKPAATAGTLGQVVITDVYGDYLSKISTYIDWVDVTGATGYDVQVNYKENGTWSGWKSTFKDRLFNLNQKFHVVKRQPITIDKYTSKHKYHAYIDYLYQDEDMTYKFRVRAKNSKGVGPWSEEFTLKQTMNEEEIRNELVRYMQERIEEYRPDFEYLDGEYTSLEGTTYRVDGLLGAFTIYAKQEDVLARLKIRIAHYLEMPAYTFGSVYLEKITKGRYKDAFDKYMEDDEYYTVFILGY